MCRLLLIVHSHDGWLACWRLAVAGELIVVMLLRCGHWRMQACTRGDDGRLSAARMQHNARRLGSRKCNGKPPAKRQAGKSRQEPCGQGRCSHGSGRRRHPPHQARAEAHARVAKRSAGLGISRCLGSLPPAAASTED